MQPMLRYSLLALALHSGALGAGPAVAYAQEPDAQRKAVAEALFDEGRALLAQGEFQAACQRLEQSQAIDAGVGTLLYLGECYARVGKVASAWAIFREAASAARASGQADRARMGDERARELEYQLSQLAVVVPPEQPPGFELALNGHPLSSALYGVFFPVDAGRHQLLARAPGFDTWSLVIDVAGTPERQTVQVAPLQRSSSAQTVRVEPAMPAPGSAFGGDRVSDAPSSERLVAYGLAGGGLLALGAGVVFGLQASSKSADADRYCQTNGCFDPRGEVLNDSARDWALVANISYGVGVAALAAGAVVFFTAGKAGRSAHLRLEPLIGTAPGLALAGAL